MKEYRDLEDEPNKEKILSDEEFKENIKEKIRKRNSFSSDSSSGTGIVAAFIGIMVAVIVGVGVAMPVIQEVIMESNSTTMYGTLSESLLEVFNLFPILLAVTILVAIIGMIVPR